MTTATRPLITVGQCLPRLSFPLVAAPGMVSWTQGTMASVVFVPHLGRCRDCIDYAGQLATAVGGLREWATRAMVLVAPGTAVAADRAGVMVLDDEGGRGRAQLGVGEAQAAVVQADRWGAVYQVEAIGTDDGHRQLPAPRDLVALAQFIDIQCPECGVPSKEWLSASPFPLG